LTISTMHREAKHYTKRATMREVRLTMDRSDDDDRPMSWDREGDDLVFLLLLLFLSFYVVLIWHRRLLVEVGGRTLIYYWNWRR